MRWRADLGHWRIFRLPCGCFNRGRRDLLIVVGVGVLYLLTRYVLWASVHRALGY